MNTHKSMTLLRGKTRNNLKRKPQGVLLKIESKRIKYLGINQEGESCKIKATKLC